MTEKQSSFTLCKNITSLDISNHIPFIDHIPLGPVIFCCNKLQVNNKIE